MDKPHPAHGALTGLFPDIRRRLLMVDGRKAIGTTLAARKPRGTFSRRLRQAAGEAAESRLPPHHPQGRLLGYGGRLPRPICAYTAKDVDKDDRRYWRRVASMERERRAGVR